MRKLVIGNKNYSSWSMRPWVLMRQFGLSFDEVKLRFDDFDVLDGPFQRAVAKVSPAARVPVLVEPDGFAVWDTLAIVEYLADQHPEHAVWPREARARARARCLAAEMHAGFSALRSHCPMNIEAALPEIGARILAEQPAVRRDLERITAAFDDALQTSRGPFLFGDFGAVDAYYAPVAARIRTYGLPVAQKRVADYLDRLWAAPGVTAWVADALAEGDFLDFEEPYRKQR
jgi:glutathione S-transferase